MRAGTRAGRSARSRLRALRALSQTSEGQRRSVEAMRLGVVRRELREDVFDIGRHWQERNRGRRRDRGGCAARRARSAVRGLALVGVAMVGSVAVHMVAVLRARRRIVVSEGHALAGRHRGEPLQRHGECEHDDGDKSKNGGGHQVKFTTGQ